MFLTVCDVLRFLFFLQILLLSRLTAIALLVVYGSYLVFQLGTHHYLFGGEGEESGTPQLTLTAAIIWLSGITVLVAFLSEYLTGSIEEVCGLLAGRFGLDGGRRGYLAGWGLMVAGGVGPSHVLGPPGGSCWHALSRCHGVAGWYGSVGGIPERVPHREH